MSDVSVFFSHQGNAGRWLNSEWQKTIGSDAVSAPIKAAAVVVIDDLLALAYDTVKPAAQEDLVKLAAFIQGAASKYSMVFSVVTGSKIVDLLNEAEGKLEGYTLDEIETYVLKALDLVP